MNYLIVSLGAAIGGGLRYWFENIIYKIFPVTFPFGTFAVNFIGSFILGILIFYFDERELLSSEIKLFLTVGFCGGFTTFSTFSFETINLLKNSQMLLGLSNIFFNLVFCLTAVYLAYLISR